MNAFHCHETKLKIQAAQIMNGQTPMATIGQFLFESQKLIDIRESRVTNIKHHYWWKLNFIKSYFNFERLILLEEDHALLDDAFFMVGHLSQFKCDNSPCDILSLGTYQNNLKQTAAVSFKAFYSTIYKI